MRRPRLASGWRAGVGGAGEAKRSSPSNAGRRCCAVVSSADARSRMAAAASPSAPAALPSVAGSTPGAGGGALPRRNDVDAAACSSASTRAASAASRRASRSATRALAARNFTLICSDADRAASSFSRDALDAGPLRLHLVLEHVALACELVGPLLRSRPLVLFAGQLALCGHQLSGSTDRRLRRRVPLAGRRPLSRARWRADLIGIGGGDQFGQLDLPTVGSLEP